MKRSLTIALVFAMLLSFAAVASAEEAASAYTITIDNESSGYTYAAYQIFSGELATLDEGSEDEKTVLANIRWGSNVDTAGADFQTNILAALGVTVGEGENFTPYFVAQNLTDSNADAFAKAIANYLTGTGTEFTYNETGKKYTAQVPAGYYLIRNTAVPSDGAYTAFILDVAGNVTTKPKAEVPTIEKKVRYYRWNGNDYAGSTYRDATDAPAGGNAITPRPEYQVTATIPGGLLQDYTSYKVIIKDTLSKGLKYSSLFSLETWFPRIENYDYRISAYLHRPESSSYSNAITFTSSTNGDGEEAIEITINDIIALYENYDESYSFYDDVDCSKPITIRLSYSARLNENAVFGSAGNPNTVFMEYSNNPNGEGMGKTPEDTAIVFTYKLHVDKVDQDNKPLTGADFTLYKRSSRIVGNRTGAEIKANLAANVKADALKDDETYLEIDDLRMVPECRYGIKTGDTSGNAFEFKGLDAGDYILVETTVPDGYNPVEPIEFTITAEHEAEGNPAKLLSLSAGDNFPGTVDMTSGTLSLTVVNKSGVALPSTGGMGTTIFYIFGTVLALGAGILLIAKKRAAQ